MAAGQSNRVTVKRVGSVGVIIEKGPALGGKMYLNLEEMRSLFLELMETYLEMAP